MAQTKFRAGVFLILAMLFFSTAVFPQEKSPWKESFAEDSTTLLPQGKNPYFILEPGYQLKLAGKEGAKQVALVITVLRETKLVDGIRTRIVEERETAGGNLVEISRNFFAVSRTTNGVYYFGEEVDMYKDGKVANHEGSWLAGVGGARYGLLIPGAPAPGSRFYQELAPGVAMDRSEIVSLSETVVTPAGNFETCLKTEETTPLEPSAKEYKLYAKGVGLVKDGQLSLVSHGYARK